MNNNIIMFLRTRRQRMPMFEIEIYIPLTRVKPRCPVFYFIVPVVSKLAVRHCKSERSNVIYSVSIMMRSLLLQRLETKTLWYFRCIKNSLKIPKGAIRIHISKKNRQHNDQKKIYKRTNNDQQSTHIKLKIK